VASATPSGIGAASGFFVLRAPLLPFDELAAWGEGLRSRSEFQDAARADDALAADRAELRRRLARTIARSDVREAIFIASASLYESLDLWNQDPESDRGQRVERALVRYFARMTGRPTPFGLFAGCSLGRIGGRTHAVLGASSDSTRQTRFDMDYLVGLTDQVARDPALRDGCIFTPNSSLYEVPGHVRYVESRVDGTSRSYHLVSADANAALLGTIARAAGGATADTLVRALVSDEISAAEAGAYIQDLIDSQILVPDIGVPLTGNDATEAVVVQLGKRPATSEVANVLQEARNVLETLDARGLGNSADSYRVAARLLEQLPAKPDMARLFQVDLFRKSPDLALGPAVVDELAAGIRVLHRLAPPPSAQLKDFREAFTERYEAQEVPLVEALDDEFGVGFGSADTSPLLNGMAFPPGSWEGAPWTPRDRVLLQKLSNALMMRQREIVLSAQDIDQLAGQEQPPLPGSFAAIATLAASSTRALDDGDFQIRMHSVEGPPGTRLLGRFCYGDPGLRERIEAHAASEASLDPDTVLAEVVHLPQARLGNVLLRPVLREYEIPYLGLSGAPHARQIPITDLMVSVVGDQVVLRSRTLGRRVRPRLTTAHNFMWNSLPTYRFLCALQSQGTTMGLAWDWGALGGAPFLPRVVAGRLVLAAAKWRFEADDLKHLVKLTGTPLFRAVQAVREQRGLPRWIAFMEGENAFPVDLDNVLSVESLISLVKDRTSVTLEEMWPAPENLCVSAAAGRFVHELIVPFLRDGQPGESSARPVSLSAAPARPVRRTFPPGSEWLYVKLRTGTATADDILRDVVGPVAAEAMSTAAADQWFFVRYKEAGPHLRVRFHGDSDALQRVVWPRFHSAIEPFLADGRVCRVTLDSYEREIERYGGPHGILLAEQVFHADSEAVVDILDRLEPGDRGLDARWRLALCGMHGLLGDAGFDLDARLAVVTESRNALAREFRSDKTLEHQLGDRFRHERSGLMDLLANRSSIDDDLQAGLDLFACRSARLRPVFDDLRALAARGLLSESVPSIVTSFVHMHVNRLLRSLQREQEFVLYDFLLRTYRSTAARRTERPGASRANSQSDVLQVLA
jgi:class I lanthipeptide synthase